MSYQVLKQEARSPVYFIWRFLILSKGFIPYIPQSYLLACLIAFHSGNSLFCSFEMEIRFMVIDGKLSS